MLTEVWPDDDLDQRYEVTRGPAQRRAAVSWRGIARRIARGTAYTLLAIALTVVAAFSLAPDWQRQATGWFSPGVSPPAGRSTGYSTGCSTGCVAGECGLLLQIELPGGMSEPALAEPPFDSDALQVSDLARE
jgi:hypothetical protein